MRGRNIAAEGAAIVSCLVVASALIGCTAMLPHNPPPKDLYEQVQVPDLPNVRYWGDVAPNDLEHRIALRSQRLRERFADEIAAGKPIRFSYLALSGGGANGAFGAGLLNGWDKTGTRPEFEAVTGISTGALIAPYAFLGPDYEDELREVFTTISTDNILIARFFRALFGALSVADSTPLRQTIARYMTLEVLDKIGAERRKGRSLLIGTTNLDAGRLVVWDIGRLANSGHPRRLQLFHDILTASASIPGVFPPVFFDVELAGQPFKELHVDGGITAQVFAYPPAVTLNTLEAKLGHPIEQTLYVIRNGKLKPDYEKVKPGWLSISGRSIGVLINQQGIGDVQQIFFTAQRDNVEFRLSVIPPEFNVETREVFDSDYMRALYDLGYEIGRAGDFWMTSPPDLADPVR